ncbi:DeoR family fructose operon transcriptional repressor [Okibacterium sp. HSC-33S16]|uniref:DeoR/GlpR family DNA-binding transcription regulator n=1 Tax=Okibacterium sp. HSC-33S16 TaxID=2910965 RepID=UPI00209E0209|nr:DeoR/GlpR family DNA-binding transcription regulator [Okibacterium sp. HSC-33S16]MCP2032131.1 DeoR family fructose operon transcriptional repressor [Okibacterium sp. HSC-33S16]
MAEMERLYAEERRFAIARAAKEDGRVEVASLASRFGVSAETVRQDLNNLQSSGLVRRVHGGAIPVDRLLFEESVGDRTRYSAEKNAIAKAAVASVPASGAIFIESGSTSMMFAEHMPKDRELTVFTNSLPIALFLAAEPALTVLTLGGRVRPVTLGEVDRFAIRSLQEIQVDVAFLGTNGLSASHGLTTPDQTEADFKRETLRSANHRVLLADRSKVGTVALWRYGSVEDLDVVITNAGADEAILDHVKASGPKLILV